MAITRAQQARQMLKKGSEPVEQAGVMNYMPSEMVTVPKIAKSSPDTPTAKLAYITPKEQDILIDLNLYGSLNGKPNRGPGGVPSLEGDFGSPTGQAGGKGGTYSGGGGGSRSDNDVSGKKDTGTGDYRDSNRPEDIAARREYEVNRRKREQKAKEEKKKTIRDRINEYNRNYKKKQLARYQKSKIDELNAKLAGLENFDGFYGDTDETYKDFIENYAPSVTTFGPKETGGTGKYSQEFIDDVLSGKRPPPESFTPINPDAIPTLAGKGVTAFANLVGPKMAGPTTKEELMDLYSGGLDSYIGARDLNVDDYTGREMMEIFEPKRFEREFGDSRDDRGDPFIPIIPKMDDTEDTTPVRNLAGLSPRIGGSLFNFDEFAADGGRIGAMEGGIMDIARQEMFLGGIAKGIKKAVKGVSRAVKKVAKSPIGKAAILGAIGYGLGGGTFFGKALPGVGTGGGFSFKNILPNLMGVKETGGVGVGFEGILGKLGLTKGFGSAMPTVTGGITLASILPLLVGKTEEEKKNILDEYYASQQLTPSQSVRGVGSEMDFYNYNLPVTAADGGRIGYQEGSKEPVAKETMPLLDMDGKEMDLREEGGFVPIGRMEKADDVPARLSKNEFVFTADAVRNAGDGDVDKGAEVMYNMMKNLESGGDVSEESQGLEGAREMFQTSKRLEEVL